MTVFLKGTAATLSQQMSDKIKYGNTPNEKRTERNDNGNERKGWKEGMEGRKERKERKERKRLFELLSFLLKKERMNFFNFVSFRNLESFNIIPALIYIYESLNQENLKKKKLLKT